MDVANIYRGQKWRRFGIKKKCFLEAKRKITKKNNLKEENVKEVWRFFCNGRVLGLQD